MAWKLGSLFDGSGGFPLAASLCGIEPVWASEIEPYPIAVTRSRFPHMKHLGDISKINGAEMEPVDIITFGSPCQDLSVAGKRAGLKHEANGDEETTRSGLFMEAVRIIREMREATNGEYPRFALWENVPGAFSSNKGEDFRIVLEELIKIVEPRAAMPEVPPKGWSYADSYIGDGWSLAYRVFDAQYWGVPQRRRRIHLIADFRGECAREVKAWMEGTKTITGLTRPGLATAGEVSEIASNLDALTTRVTTAEGDIDALEGRMEAAEGDIDALEGRMDTAEDDIEALKAAVGTAGEDSLGARVTSLEGRMTDAESDIAAHTTAIGNNATAIENITKADTGAIAVAVKAEADRAQGIEAGLQSAIDTLNGANTVDGSVAKAVKDAVDAEAAIRESADAALGGRIDGVKVTVEAADTLSKANKALLDVLVPAEADRTKTVRAIAADEINTLIGAADDEGGETIQKVADLVNYVEKNAGEIAGLISTVNGHTESFSSVAGQITALQNKDTALDGDILAINNKIGTGTLPESKTTLIDAINAVSAAVTAGDAATLESAKGYSDGKLAAAIETINSNAATLGNRVKANEDKLVGIGGTDQPGTVIAAIESAIAVTEGKITTLESGKVQANADAIAAINHTSTGILAKAKDYTDGQIAEVESALAGEKTARENFDKTALTGVITNNTLAISLDGAKLELEFHCGGAAL